MAREKMKRKNTYVGCVINVCYMVSGRLFKTIEFISALLLSSDDEPEKEGEVSSMPSSRLEIQKRRRVHQMWHLRGPRDLHRGNVPLTKY